MARTQTRRGAGLTPFDDEDQAIAYASDTVYGLAADFHTHDSARLLRVAEKLVSVKYVCVGGVGI
jgi:acyl-CoA reductase-like NAD-dependent aldehyde dehydrogenase